NVVAVAESARITHPGKAADFLTCLAADARLILQGVSYMAQLRAAGVTFLEGYAATKAEGGDRLTGVVLQQTGDGRRARSRTIATDWLCLSYGFAPNVELTRLLGCEHRYDPSRGCLVPVTDEVGRSSLANVFVVGDGAGI